MAGQWLSIIFFMLSFGRQHYEISGNRTDGEEKKDVGMGLLV